MNNYSRLFGGILLIAGTSIGAGMLALPVASFFGGFFPSVLMFIIVWGLMLLSAHFFLDVNLEMKGEPNFISMANKTLGPIGKAVSLCFYLLLLYALLAAYLSALSPFFSAGFKAVFKREIPPNLAPFCLPIILGGFIYLGTRGLDYFNRILMVGLGISYIFLIGFVPAHIDVKRLLHVDFSASLIAVPIIITSFGYHIIIPTLTTYLDHRRGLLRAALWIGSLIPFFVYLLWQIVILGAVPFESLAKAWNLGLPATEPLAEVLGASWIAPCALFFSFFVVATSFLGVALSLTDFLLDAFPMKKNSKGRLLAITCTFIPPLVFVFFYQEGFYLALEYAGFFVVILLGIIPSLMVLKLKTTKKYKQLNYRILVYSAIVLFICIIAIIFFDKIGFLHRFLDKYV